MLWGLIHRVARIHLVSFWSRITFQCVEHRAVLIHLSIDGHLGPSHPLAMLNYYCYEHSRASVRVPVLSSLERTPQRMALWRKNRAAEHGSGPAPQNHASPKPPRWSSPSWSRCWESPPSLRPFRTLSTSGAQLSTRLPTAFSGRAGAAHPS